MCEGDIKILLGTTFHYKLINLISKMNLLNLTNFINIKEVKRTTTKYLTTTFDHFSSKGSRLT